MPNPKRPMLGALDPHTLQLVRMAADRRPLLLALVSRGPNVDDLVVRCADASLSITGRELTPALRLLARLVAVPGLPVAADGPRIAAELVLALLFLAEEHADEIGDAITVHHAASTVWATLSRPIRTSLDIEHPTSRPDASRTEAQPVAALAAA